MGNNFSYRNAFKSSFEKQCIQLIVEAYQVVLAEKKYSPDWLENDFTSLLNNAIENSSYRIHNKISNKREKYLFSEVKADHKGFADSEDRIDLVFSTFRANKEYCHFFEAKRLKESDSSLHKRYIATGIDSFLSGKYPKGCMIAYLVEGNVHNAINSGINKMLIKHNREKEILYRVNISIHEYYYESTHLNWGILKHLILDFTI